MSKKQTNKRDLFPFSWEIFLTNYYHIENEYNYCLEDLSKTNKKLAEAEKANDLDALNEIETQRIKLCRVRDRLRHALENGKYMHEQGLNYDGYKSFFALILEIYEIEGGVK